MASSVFCSDDSRLDKLTFMLLLVDLLWLINVDFNSLVAALFAAMLATFAVCISSTILAVPPSPSHHSVQRSVRWLPGSA